MARAKDVIRILGGIFVIISGFMLLGLFGWEPPIAGPEARPFQAAMHEAGYFLPIIMTVFLITGASFVLNLYGAISSIVLLPISVNIVLFHTVLEAGQAPVAIAFFAINCFMLWYYRAAYAPLLRPRIANKKQKRD